MHNILNFPSFPWLLIFLITLLKYSSAADPRISEAGLFCDQHRPPANVTFIVPLFVKEMEHVSSLVNTSRWGYYAENSTELSIYALAQCYDDLSMTDCLLCYAAARTRIPRCLPRVSARLYLDGCFIRYDNYGFGNEAVNITMDRTVCSNSSSGLGASFVNDARELIDNLTNIAVSSDGYAVKEAKGVYGLAQCWKTLSKAQCEKCLTMANNQTKGCLPNNEGRALNTGCYMRYSNEKFYSEPEDTSGNSEAKTGMIVGISLGVLAFCMLLTFFAYTCYARRKKSKQERINLGQISNLYNKSDLNYKYDVLEKSTNYFDESTKVGQGGAGSVYKGTLPNGKIVAVKRLFFNTRQWVDEFFNEVNLVSGINHKNLVKLLGCSIEGPESLLVYEFIHNKSLDQYLFDKDKVKVLNWKERFNIIVGTAEGLAFLHGGSEIRIIHRDIKSSNVLLDENLSPKIADFGLARHFADDKTHLSTGIAGTLGYMAPEYIVKGQLTEKADVFSYGVLVLEVVCGRKNIAFMDESGSLLQAIWSHYKTNTMIEAIDPSLKGDFPPNEALEVLRIALLCTQASATARPSMPEVFKMLTDKNCPIPVPNQPPFLSANLLASSSIRPHSVGSFVSNSLGRIETSFTSSDTFSMQSSEGQQQRSA